jgi:pyruvate,water dikinase
MVLATGGVLSHGVIVAREYGIPVVAGVKEATNRIANGQLIAIDGTQGEIRLLAPEHETRDP